MIGVPARLAKPTANVDIELSVPICVPLDQDDWSGSIENTDRYCVSYNKLISETIPPGLA